MNNTFQTYLHHLNEERNKESGNVGIVRGGTKEMKNVVVRGEGFRGVDKLIGISIDKI